MEIPEVLTNELGDGEFTKAQPWMVDAVLAIPIQGKEERSYHLDAFRYWFNGGDKRTHSDVARHFNKSQRTISIWSSSYRWGDRRKAIEEMIKQYIIENISDDADAHFTHMFDMLDKADQAYVKALGNPFLMNKPNVTDVKKLIETRMLLLGKPTERIDVVSASREVDPILDDAETIRLASALFQRLGQGNASRSGEAG